LQKKTNNDLKKKVHCKRFVNSENGKELMKRQHGRY